MGQAGVCSPAPSYFTGGLVVQLQRKLNVSRRLGTGDLPHCGAEAHVWRVEFHVVKGGDEVGSELQSKPLCQLEVLRQAQIYVCVVRPSQPAELRRAITEGSHCRIGKVAVVGEPLDTSNAGNRCVTVHMRKREAVRSRPAAKRAGFVLRSIYWQRPASTEGHDGANLPAANDGVEYSVHVVANRLTAANWQFVNGIACQHMRGIVVARRPLRLAVVNVLPVRRCTEGIIPSAIVTRTIGHAF